MSYGPIELLVVEFPGNQFTGEIAPALTELVESGMIRIIDILFVQKDANGVVTETELTDLFDDVFAAFHLVVDELAGLITHDDALQLSTSLPPNSSAGIMLFENASAKRFVDAVANANGHVVVNERIPRAVIDALVTSLAEPAA